MAALDAMHTLMRTTPDFASMLEDVLGMTPGRGAN